MKDRVRCDESVNSEYVDSLQITNISLLSLESWKEKQTKEEAQDVWNEWGHDALVLWLYDILRLLVDPQRIREYI